MQDFSDMRPNSVTNNKVPPQETHAYTIPFSSLIIILTSLLHEKAETFFSHTESTFFVLSVCEKNASAFSCNSEVLQYKQIIHQLY